jgi:hypothetical protein
MTPGEVGTQGAPLGPVHTRDMRNTMMRKKKAETTICMQAVYQES